MGEFEHQGRRQRAVCVHELAELREKLRVGQGRRRDVAEHSNLAVFRQQPARHLDAAEQHEMVDLRHQAGRLRVGEEVDGRDDFAVAGPQPRHRLVVAPLALRQRDDGLQIEVKPIGLDRSADHGEDGIVLHALEAAA